jgi:hypothetical protein
MNEIIWNSSSTAFPRSRLRSLQAADRQIGFHSARGVQRAGVDRLAAGLAHVVSEDAVGHLLSVFAQEIIAELYTSYKTCRTLLPSNGLLRTCAKSERKFDTKSSETFHFLFLLGHFQMNFT